MGETRPHPLNRRGRKHIDCLFYEHCLTFAAKRNWRTWSCEQCPYSKMKAIFQTIRYIEPYYGLLADIYPEFKTRYEPVMHLLSLNSRTG